MYQMPDILLCNDDGWESAGLHALKNELDKIGDVTVFAPSCERSWIGKKISRYNEISVSPVDPKGMIDNSEVYSVSGTPSDSCLIGTSNIFKSKGKPPDLIVSGINNGANMGLSFILSSGTVAVSLEAAMMGIPSICVSMFFQKKEHYSKGIINDIKSYDKAAIFSRMVAEKILNNGKLPDGIDFLIINVPYGIKNFDFVVTEIARIHYGYLFRKINDNTYKFDERLNFQNFKDKVPDNSDINIVINKYKISISPILLDLTGNLKELNKFLQF